MTRSPSRESGIGRSELVVAVGFTLLAALLVLPGLGERALWEDESAWEIATFEDGRKAPISYSTPVLAR